MKNQIVSNEAVQAALDAYDTAPVIYGTQEHVLKVAMQAALAAAFPIMLREVAKDAGRLSAPATELMFEACGMITTNNLAKKKTLATSGLVIALNMLADSFSEGGG